MAKQTNTPTPEELEGMSKADLTKAAKKEGVEVTSHMTKAAIVEEIQAAHPAPAAASTVESGGVTPVDNDPDTLKKLVANPGDPENYGGGMKPDANLEAEEVDVSSIAPAPEETKPEPVRSTEAASDREGRAGLGR